MPKIRDIILMEIVVNNVGSKMERQQLEKYSSAITLSDMEVFVFPELMYSLVLANIISPVIWRWRDLDCFEKLSGKGSLKKLLRLRQFIMDEYDFNLDLETWGLTTKDAEIDRFREFISPAEISASNGLFGYEGDKYYFDVDIRKHFGLDKYTTDVIPYWKTETVEAMNAFRLKDGYPRGAGECVSLSALYAAAAFIVCDVPLDDIYMVLTPLHSQNFIDIGDGIITNNRRLVTKAMWFNGTAISNKAQRALRNERVTIVAHSSGYVHCIYDDATIDHGRYRHLIERLGSYLSADLDMQMFANFLRSNPHYQRFFQCCRDCRGQAMFIKAEALFHYEHGSKFRIADATHEKLLAEVSDEDFVGYQLPGRTRCDQMFEFLGKHRPDPQTAQGRALLTQYLQPMVPNARQLVDELADFLCVRPSIPSPEKKYLPSKPIQIGLGIGREEIIDYLRQIRSTSTTADLAFYAYRDMETSDWGPFIKAALERNPVSVLAVQAMTNDQVYNWLNQMKDTSIYEGKRLGQPDEVANYHTGDGLEKAFLLANIIRQRKPEQEMVISVDNSNVILKAEKEYSFISAKGLEKQVTI